jgi:bacteriocin biosynthesis cyclodehydratase domain-containing protein
MGKEVEHAHQEDQATDSGRRDPEAGLAAFDAGGGSVARGRRRMSTAESFRIKRSVEVFPSADGRIHLLRTRGDSYAVEGASDDERQLLLALASRGPGSSGAVISAAGSIGSGRTKAILSELDDLGVLEEPEAALVSRLTNATQARLDQQLQYFAEVADDQNPHEMQQRLRTSRVTFIGVGGLGTWATLALAGCGLGRIDLIDGDCAEISNLNRQVLYNPECLGEPKVEIIARWLRTFDPECDVRSRQTMLTSEAEVREAITGSDLVVLAADWPLHTFSDWVDAACFDLGIPYCSGAVVAPIVRAGPTYIPGSTGCMRCLEDSYRAHDPLFDELLAFRRAGAANAATTGPACALLGALLASDALNLLSGVGAPATLGKAISVDVRTLRPEVEEVYALRQCSRCGGSAVPTGS